MNDPRDGLEFLRENNPVNESDVETHDSSRAQDLFAKVVATPLVEIPPRRISSSRRFRLVIALLAVAALTTAAAWLWTRTIDLPNAVTCYQAVDPDADAAAAPAGSEATAGACAPVWEAGILVNTGITPAGSVPPLTACVAENGALAVFPTADTTVCSSFGLAYPEPADQDQADDVRDVEMRLIAYFQSHDCLSMADAEITVRRILSESGFNEWTVQSQPVNPERPCASHSFDPQATTVHLIPIPRTES
jgi:hypothetical protein